MFKEYLDFEIAISPASGRRYRVIVSGPGGDAPPTTIALPPKTPRYQALAEALARLDTNEAALVELGRILFRTLFQGPIKDVYTRAQGQLKPEQGLRLRFNIDPTLGQVVALPWEFLADPDQPGPMAMLDAPIVRYLPQQAVIPSLATTLPLKVLVTGAVTPPEPNVEQELEEVRSALTGLGHHVDITVEPHLTKAKLREWLRRGFHVWHFIGHGGATKDGMTGTLLFEDATGSSEAVTATELGSMLFRKGVRLIILDACNSAKLMSDTFRSVAPALIQAQVPAVVAMQFTVPQEVTRAFAGEFYRALAQGFPIDACVTEGRVAVMNATGLRNPDWGIPVVYTRAPDGRLFDLPTQAALSPEAPSDAPPIPPASAPDQTEIISIEEGERDGNISVYLNEIVATESAASISTAPPATVPQSGPSELPKHEQAPLVAPDVIVTRQSEGYSISVPSESAAQAFVELSDALVADLVARARKALKEIVYAQVDNQYIYQQADTSIAPDTHVASLQALARTGYYLYQKLFYAPGSKPEVRALGNLLQQLSSQRRLRIQVTDDHYNFPWMLLYDRPTLDLKAIDAESFWGFKHLIENLPSAGDSPPDDLNNLIRVDDGISFGWVYDTGLDNLVGQPAIAQQREFLSALPNVALSEHPNRQDLFDLLNNPDAPAQLLYVLCPLSAKKLRMSDAPVSLDELSIFAPTSDPALKQRPLVFVNGLLSAADSPYLHDGLLPYLIAKGARGVIGAYATELPFFFAAEFAQAFFERCTAGGQSVGEILYELRRAYVREKSNVLGLIYALYGSADIVFQARQRAIKLTIDRQGNEYLFTLHDEGQASAIINLSDAQIADLVERARKTMNTILMTQVNDEYVYQAEHPAVPADVHVETLKSLAKTGYYLYERLFYAPGSSPAARAMGEQLRRLSQENRLQIEISTERFSFPWMLLYDRAPLDLEQIDLEHFWGFKHIVNYTLGYDTVPAIASDSLIVVGDTLPIGFVLNSTIDTQFGQPIVQKQGDRLRALPQVVVREYPNCQDLLDVLNNPDAPEQLFYFYCHGVKGTTLALSDGRVHVDDLQIFAPTSGPPLKQAPLMFMNAIDSARLSPYLYDGLVPYLLERGARTIIGVEAEIGIYFAAEFGQEFIRRFIAGGRPAGKLLRDLRREYALKQHNLMGLVYVLYGSGDTVIQKTT